MIGPEGYDYMKLTARQKYDHRDLDRGEGQLIRVGDMPCGGIVENWATRWLKDRASTQRLRVFGRPKGSAEQNWPRRERCGS